MSQIGPGGSFQKPFQTNTGQSQTGQSRTGGNFSSAQNQNASAASSGNANTLPGQLPSLNPSQLAGLLGQLLLSPAAAQNASLSSLQLSLLLRSLFQLPSELQQFLAQVVTGQTGTEEQQQLLRQLLQENPGLPLNLEDLQSLLQQAISKNDKKLLQLLQSSNQAQAVNSQASANWGELLGVISQLKAQVGSTPLQSLNTTFLLYLPWYPLAAQQKLTLHFEAPKNKDKDGGEGEGADASQADQSHLVMLIDTNCLGRFKILTLRLDRTQLMFHVEYDASALSVIPSLEHRVSQALTKAGLPLPEFEWKQRGVSRHLFDDSTQPLTSAQSQATDAAPPLGESDSQEREDKQAVAVHNVGQVPVIVVQGAYWVARLVFELDNQQLEEPSA
ncbi:MAG: hypothetical protein VKJ04_04055 [Vampirovibrionales bacterium]|nr:hypothetical protein [Vampirovibrionales bacterium]